MPTPSGRRERELMSRIVLERIRKLVEDYVACWKAGESGIVVKDVEKLYIGMSDTPCERKYLITVHYSMHELPFDVLKKLPVILVKTHEAQNVNHDHKYLWAWTAQIVNETHKELPLFRDTELLRQVNLLFRINLLPERRLLQVFPEIIDVISQIFVISAHLAFPLLERLLRAKCIGHVKVDGIVTKCFEVPDARRYEVGRRVNKVGHLLYLFEHNYATDELRSDLEDFRSLCVKVYGADGGKYGYRFIDGWRNALLHGEEFWPTMNAAVVNLITLIILHEIPSHRYFDAKKRVVENLKFWLETGFKPPSIFYPPEI